MGTCTSRRCGDWSCATEPAAGGGSLEEWHVDDAIGLEAREQHIQQPERAEERGARVLDARAAELAADEPHVAPHEQQRRVHHLHSARVT